MGVFDKWLRGVTSPDRSRKPTPSRPTSSIGNTVRNRQTPPVRPSAATRPTVPVKHHPDVPVKNDPAPKPTPKPLPKPVEPSETETTPTVKPVVSETISEKPKTSAPSSAFEPVLQRKLDRYFERLRAVYPTGVITRLNTGQKKLAERGAQLRRMCGMENELDAFFALGGFTYERTAGGRPRNVQDPLAQDALVTEVQALFPKGIPSAAALDRADHSLYLRLRSAARLSGLTLTDFLKNNNLNT